MRAAGGRDSQFFARGHVQGRPEGPLTGALTGRDPFRYPEESPGPLGLSFSEVMSVRFLLILGRRSLEEFFADNCFQMAAAISYYVLFSLFPLLRRRGRGLPPP